MKILKPTIGRHDGSSFRELLDMWAEEGYCEVVENTECVPYHYADETLFPEAHPWINKVGGIMLYDMPLLDKLHDRLSWEMALWANEVHQGKNSYPWIFWPKHSKIHAKVRRNGIVKYDDREGESVFIGSFTTPARAQFATDAWRAAIQLYWLGRPGAQWLEHEKYLKVLGCFKYGLCLPGVGPKCLRDVELMGLGTVPIFTPGVSCEYYDPPVRDQHFLFASSAEDIPEVIASCSKEKWEYMSNECIQWFKRNASARGSFETTQRIIETHKK